MPASDFGSHDSEFTPSQEAECRRIVDGVRAINSRILRLGGSLESLTAAADRVEALLGTLDEVTRARALVTYKVPFDLGEPNGILPFNPATGSYNPLAPGLDMEVEGEKLVVRCEFPNAYESGPETVQGGMVAAIYDQILAYAVMVHGRTGPTLWVKVDFRRPTPINVPLRFEAVVTAVEGKKFSVEGSCYRGEEKITDASALVLGSIDLPVRGGSEE